MRADYVDREALGHVLAAMMPPNALAIEVAAYTGLRIDDVLHLRTEQLARRMVIRERKTGKRRRISVSQGLLDRMIAQAGRIWVWEGRNDYRRPRTRQAVYRDIRRAAAAFRLRGHISPHSARKLYAVEQLARAGGDLDTVRRKLGHSDPAITAIYALADQITAQRLARSGRKS